MEAGAVNVPDPKRCQYSLCGKVMPQRAKKYCSSACRFAANNQKRRPPVEKTCPTCGQTFMQAAGGRHAPRKFCKPSCRQSAYRLGGLSDYSDEKIERLYQAAQSRQKRERLQQQAQQ